VSDFIMHITTRRAWEEAVGAGSYEPDSLSEDGFIHFSAPHQVLAVANAAFSGATDLVLVCAAPARLVAPLDYEGVVPGGERFPHLYGPLNLDAVVTAVPFPRGEDSFALPPGLERLLGRADRRGPTADRRGPRVRPASAGECDIYLS
jgi:uncharacterized protein (DUF952 family)